MSGFAAWIFLILFEGIRKRLLYHMLCCFLELPFTVLGSSPYLSLYFWVYYIYLIDSVVKNQLYGEMISQFLCFCCFCLVHRGYGLVHALIDMYDDVEYAINGCFSQHLLLKFVLFFFILVFSIDWFTCDSRF